MSIWKKRQSTSSAKNHVWNFDGVFWRASSKENIANAQPPILICTFSPKEIAHSQYREFSAIHSLSPHRSTPRELSLPFSLALSAYICKSTHTISSRTIASCVNKTRSWLCVCTTHTYICGFRYWKSVDFVVWVLSILVLSINNNIFLHALIHLHVCRVSTHNQVNGMLLRLMSFKLTRVFVVFIMCALQNANAWNKTKCNK